MTASFTAPSKAPAPALSDLGIYVHFPWCLKKCPYCDFLSVAVPSPTPGKPVSTAEARAQLPHAAYADAVIRELEIRAAQAWPDAKVPRVQSVFFGGGTPSLWNPRELGRVLKSIQRLFSSPAGSEWEVTVECNPTSIDTAHLECLLEEGVNRVSIGVQALDNERLEFLGRLHDGAGGLTAVRTAIEVGVPRVSADLIFGVYKQTPDKALADVEAVAATGVGHMSAYSLTIEPGTRFGALNARGKLPLLDDALVADSFEQVSTFLQAAGFEHYEISNYARPGLRSVHNVGYWTGRDYLGVGTGAYGTVQLEHARIRYRNQLSPERYMSTWLDTETASADVFREHLTEFETISGDEAIQEALLLGLRIAEGIDIEAVANLRGGVAFPSERAQSLEKLCAEGRIVRDGRHLRLPRSEWIFADRTIRDLL